ncbi:hypothetical protein IAT40_007851 [Kwoniella sp. CBS 6097]
MTTLLTLPPHLREAIQELILADNVDLPTDLRDGLNRTLAHARAHADTHTSATTRDDDAAVGDNGGIKDRSGAGAGDETNIAAEAVIDSDRTEDLPNEDNEGEAGAGNEHGTDTDKVVDTIPLDLVERLSRWCSTDTGRDSLKANNLDPVRYSDISLMAGTEVYIPPSELERLRAAENPDKPNPFLPSYFSPVQPSIGSEYRALTKQLTTAINIVFSIVGSGAAVYVASTTGAGYTRETAVLLAVLTGVVVGLADMGLLWIFSTRLEGSRKERFENSVKMLKGSGKIDQESESEKKDIEGQQENMNQIGGDHGRGKEVREQVGIPLQLQGKEDTTVTGVEKRQVRLRRKKLDKA